VTDSKKETKANGDLENVGTPTDTKVVGAKQDAGQPQAGANTSETPTAEPTTKFTLTPVKEEDAVVPSLVTLEFQGEEATHIARGDSGQCDVLRKGDRITVNNVEAAELLGLSVSGDSAFKQV